MSDKNVERMVTGKLRSGCRLEKGNFRDTTKKLYLPVFLNQ